MWKPTYALIWIAEVLDYIFGSPTRPPAHHAPLEPGTYLAWAAARDRAAALVANMTLVEKVNLTSGVDGPCQANSGSVPRLDIPSFCYNDGPAGLRYTDFVTQYPSQFTLAMTWDRSSVWDMIEHMSDEFAAKGVNVELGPLTGGPLGRSPFGGRNWEAFTPDPYLSSTMSYIAIRAAQSSGLIACAKHYFLYEQEPVCKGPLDEGHRTGCADVHSMVDDKTVKELYLPSFAEAVRAGVGAVMCSYNQINDTPACQSSDSMTRILKEELNFQGFVLSDFDGTHSTVESANAGMDQELPGTHYYGDRLTKAVKAGDVSEKRLDDMVTRILTPWIALGQADKWRAPTYTKWGLADEVHVNGRVYHNLHEDNRQPETADLARRVAEHSHVLLKNDGVLPLNSTVRRIGVFGTDADYPVTISGCGGELFCREASERWHWNGTVTIGGGSGAAYATYIVPPIEAISRRGRAHGLRVDHVLRDDATFFPAIAEVAGSVQVCLVFVSVFLVEGWNRATLKLDNDGQALIKHVADTCAGDVVVVIHAGGQVTLEDWIDHPKVKGVIFAGYPGQESGNALVNVLWGDVNPSGKLAFTMGRREEDWPPGNILQKKPKHGPPRAEFTERLAIDYKWFDLQNIKPRFEFGFGLSYTTFELRGLSVREEYSPDRGSIQPTNERHVGFGNLYDVIHVATVEVTNTGTVKGGEVAQLYMSFPPSETDQPPRHLRGYAKVFLSPGRRATAVFPLRKKDLSVWDVERQLWYVPKGEFVFHVGHSSRLLALNTTVYIDHE